jgi:hypothetical protein
MFKMRNYAFGLLILIAGLSIVAHNDDQQRGRGLAGIDKNNDFSKIEDQLRKEVRSPMDLEHFSRKNALNEYHLQGELQIEVAENFLTNEYSERVFINDGIEKREVIILNDSAEEFLGQEVRVLASQIDNKLYGFAQFDGLKKDIDPNPSNIDRSLVLLIDYNDSSPPDAYGTDRPFLERSTLANYLNTKYVKKYFDDILVGAPRSFVTKVEDWYRIDRSCDATHYPDRPSSTGYVSTDEMKQIIIERGIDHTQFDNVSVIVNCKSWHKWGYATLGSGLIFSDGHRVTTSEAVVGNHRLHYGVASEQVPYYNPHSFVGIYMHERIHTYSIFHSKALDCGSSKVLFPCKTVEYGNPYDTMGGGKFVTALNADLMRQKGYRDPINNYLTIDRAGIYEIDPLLSTGKNAKLGVYIKSEFTDMPVFMLENRTAKGVDLELAKEEYTNVRRGLSLYSSLSNSSDGSDGSQIRSPRFSPFFQFVDVVPATVDSNATFYDRARLDAITSSHPYFDPTTGIEIRILPPQLNKSSIPSSGKVRFSVSYDEKRRVCFKGNLAEQIADAYIARTSSGSGHNTDSARVILQPGDKFNLKMQSFLSASNPAMCLRDKIEVKVLNPEAFEGWIVPTNAGGGPGGGTGSGHDLSLVRNFEDYTKTQILSSEQEVLDNDQIPAGEYKIKMQYKNLRSGKVSYSNIIFELVKSTRTVKGKAIK